MQCLAQATRGMLQLNRSTLGFCLTQAKAASDSAPGVDGIEQTSAHDGTRLAASAEYSFVNTMKIASTF